MDINYQGVELRVDGEYTPATSENYFSESFPAEYEIYHVCAEDTDITTLLSMDQIQEIESLILEQL